MATDARATRRDPPIRPSAAPPVGGLARAARSVFLFLTVVIAVGAMGQFFLAGLSVFDTPRYWGNHATFGSALGALANLLWIPAALGRVGRKLIAGSLLLPVLFVLQHVFPEIDRPAVQALHPLNGALLFALTLWLALRAFGLLRRPPPPLPPPAA